MRYVIRTDKGYVGDRRGVGPVRGDLPLHNAFVYTPNDALIAVGDWPGATITPLLTTTPRAVKNNKGAR